ncbi:MAG: outer-membrane lipoprotein carrier protein LolA [Gammaproteobacteria bacterium]
MIPRKSVIGLEISNHHHELVALRDILGAPEYEGNPSSPLTLALGKHIGGKPVAVELISWWRGPPAPGAPAEGLVWLELGPKEARAARESGAYAQIRLGFAGSSLKRMDLRDNLNQTTRIEFKGEERNPKLDPSLFTFTPPPGVGVLDAEQDL